MNLALFAANAFRRYPSSQVVFRNAEEAESARVIADIDNNSSNDFYIDPSTPLGVYKPMQECNNSVPAEITNMFAQSIGKI